MQQLIKFCFIIVLSVGLTEQITEPIFKKTELLLKTP